MPPEIKLTVTQNDKLIQTVTKTIGNQHLVKSLEEFQVEANAALTKMIKDLGEIGEASGDDNTDEDDDDNADDDDADSSPSASEDSTGHSKSKRKKHD